jgi:N-acetylglutamate synthase-like GNAT family acetyltransferase
MAISKSNFNSLARAANKRRMAVQEFNKIPKEDTATRQKFILDQVAREDKLRNKLNINKGNVGRAWQQKLGRAKLIEEYKGHKIFQDNDGFSHKGPSNDDPNIPMWGRAKSIEEVRSNIDEYLNNKLEKRFVNAEQTPEERRAKYKIAQSLGMSPKEARVFRDREFPKMYRRLGLQSPKGQDKAALMAQHGFVKPKKKTAQDLLNEVYNENPELKKQEDYTPHLNKWREAANDYRGKQAVKRFEAHSKYPSSKVKTIKNDRGDIEGFIGYDHDKSGQGTINEMGVAPWAQGKGHGSKLLNDAVEDMRNDGMKEVTTHATGDAGSFYRKHGFKRVAGRIHSLDLNKSIPNTDESINEIGEDGKRIQIIESNVKKDIASIKEEAQPQKPKTKLQDKIIGDIKYLEKKEMLLKLKDVVNTISEHVEKMAQVENKKLYHTSADPIDKIKSKPMWFTDNEKNAKGYHRNTQEAAGRAHTYEASATGNILNDKELHQQAKKLKFNYDDFVGDMVSNPTQQELAKHPVVNKLKRFADGIEHPDYDPDDNQKDTKATLMFHPHKNIKLIGEAHFSKSSPEKKEMLIKLGETIKMINNKIEKSKEKCSDCGKALKPTSKVYGENFYHQCDNCLQYFCDKCSDTDEDTGKTMCLNCLESQKRSSKIEKQMKVYLEGNEMPPGDEEVMQGAKGGRYYLSSGSGSSGPVISEQEEGNNNQQDEEQAIPQMNQSVPQAEPEDEEDEINLVQPEENDDTKLQREGYAKIDLDKLLKTISNITSKTENYKNEALKDKNNIIKNIESVIKSLENKDIVDIFLKGYKEVALLGVEYPDSEINNVHNLAKEVNIKKGLNLDLKAWDRIEKILDIDKVAHALHQESKAFNIEHNAPLYPLLDKLAGISSDLGEMIRDDRLLLLNKRATSKDLDSLNSVTVFKKSISLDSGKSYWILAKKAIKDGIDSLDDDELVILREWIYARI